MTGFPFTHPTVAETDARIDRRGGRRDVPKRPMPDDFPKLAGERNIYQLVKHYRTGEKAIRRWMAECGVTPPCGLAGRPVPANFADLCANHPIIEICRQLGVDRKVVRRWMAETGIAPLPLVRKGKARPDTRFQHRPKTPKNLGQMGGGMTIHHDNRVKSIFDEAADVIRAERWIVFKCLPSGRYCATGDLWRVGNAVLTPDELLQRADKYRRRAA